MNDKEAIEMMNRCKHEIVALQEQVKYLKPKAEAYDNLAVVLRLLPQGGGVFGENFVWVLEKRIRELEEVPPEKSAP